MPGGEQYRLVVEGELTAERAAWLGADRMVAGAGRTEMMVPVGGQADLHGLLRRIRDVNLRLIEVTRIAEERSYPADSRRDTAQ